MLLKELIFDENALYSDLIRYWKWKYNHGTRFLKCNWRTTRHKVIRSMIQFSLGVLQVRSLLYRLKDFFLHPTSLNADGREASTQFYRKYFLSNMSAISFQFVSYFIKNVQILSCWEAFSFRYLYAKLLIFLSTRILNLYLFILD